jgi:hypothetical protein
MTHPGRQCILDIDTTTVLNPHHTVYVHAVLHYQQETGLSGRALLQEALSNSNGCLGTIPRCEQNACVTRNIQGGGAWACLRCLGTYNPVTDSSGQDNIIQCGEHREPV